MPMEPLQAVSAPRHGEDPVCPLCTAPARPWKTVRSHPIQICPACGHRFSPPLDPAQHVRRNYGDSYFSGSEQGYRDYLGEEPLQRASAKHYLAMLRRHRIPPGRLLDIGCAAGFHADEFRHAGWTVHGIEPNPAMADIATRKHGLTLECQDAESWQPVPQSFDLVTVLQVLSHLIDPPRLLQKIRMALAPGGHCLIETWDRSALAAGIFGSHWHEYNPPTVLHWFSRKSLRSQLRQCGFSAVAGGLPAKRIRLGRGIAMLRFSGRNSLPIRLATTPLNWIPPDWTVPWFLGDAFWTLVRRD